METSNTKIWLIVIGIITSQLVFSQNVSVSEDALYTPDPAAMLDVYSATKGMLIPRVALVDATNPISVTKPAGLLVWNTSTTGTYATPGFYFWNGSNWILLGSNALTFENGLTKTSNTIALGGTLVANTLFTTGNYNTTFNLTGTGDFDVQDDGVSTLFVSDEGSVGVGTNTPDSKAMLDVASTTKGMLVPRMTTAQRTAITSPTNGLLVFDTEFNSFFFYNSTKTKWVNLTSTARETNADEALFAIVNNVGDTVFAVYQDGVRINVIEGVGKGTKSGFAVAGISSTKGTSTEYFRVTPDSVRIYVEDEPGKGTKSGFAVAGISSSKGLGNEYFRVTTDSVRIYVDEGIAKGTKSGFAVAGISSSKGLGNEYFRVTNDSVRIYVEEGTGKGTKSGFAVAGISSSKGLGNEYFRVTTDSVRIYVDEGIAKGTKSGFAVAGISSSKGLGNEYFRVTNDSVRIYVEEGVGKGTKSGFAVAGISSSKGGPTEDIFTVTKDSTRLYVADSDAGFSIGNTESGTSKSLMKLTQENYFIGHEAGVNNTTGQYNSFIGYESGMLNTSGMNNVFLGYLSGKRNETGSDNVLIGTSVAFQHNFGNYNVLIGTRTASGTNYSGTSNVMVGSDCGLFSTTAEKNVFLGDYVGRSNTTGSQNIFIGAEAGWSNTTANNNVFLGTQAGRSNATGQNNFFAGTESGYNNTTGDFNVFLGNLAGRSNTAGTGNVYLGASAGNASQTAWQNVFLGNLAGTSFVSGDFNVFLGNEVAKMRLGGQRNVILGNQAGYSAGNGNDNVFIGNQSGYSNNGGYKNVFLGNKSGYKNTTGYSNVFIGDSAGYSNILGSSNIAIGNKAGSENSAGNYNTMLGLNAGYENTSSDNTFIGYESGRDHVTGGGNVYLGSKAGQLATSGQQNVFIGEGSGLKNAGGMHNVYVGFQSGQENTTGEKNVFLGFQAGLQNTSGNRNIFIGDSAGVTNTVGKRNVFVGYKSGMNNTTGSSNVVLGDSAYSSNTTGKYNTIIGNSAGSSMVSNNNSTFLGAGAGKLSEANNNTYLGNGTGLNNTTGSDNLSVGYNAGLWSTGSYNVFLGTEAGRGVGLGPGPVSNNVLIGYRAGRNSQASDNIFIGYQADAATTSHTNIVAIGNGVSATASNQVRLGNASTTNLFCQGAYAATSSVVPNLTVDANGQIMRSTATIAAGSGTANKLAFWSDANTLSSNTNLHWDNTNERLGVGVSSPSYKFHIVDQAETVTSTTTGAYVYSAAGATSGIAYGLRAYSYAYGTSNSYAIYADADGGGTTGLEYAFYGLGAGYFSGNVGIGLASSTLRKLGVTANSTTSYPQFELIESVADDGARLVFSNSSETLNNWTLYGRADNTDASSIFNLYYSNYGNVLSALGNGNVGIGISNPSYALHVYDDAFEKAVFENSGVTPKGYIGNDAGGLFISANAYWDGSAWNSDIATSPSFVFAEHVNNDQYEFRVRPASGSFSTAMVLETSGALGIGTTAPNSRLHINATGTGEDGFRVQINSSTKLFVANNGYVNIGGSTAPSYQLTVNGTAWCTSGAWASDLRLKKNINNIGSGTLQKLMQLRAVNFEWENPIDDGMKGIQMGFLAQDVETIFPSMVLTANDEEKTKSIKYGELFPVMVSAIQEQQAQIETLQNQISELMKVVETLKGK